MQFLGYDACGTGGDPENPKDRARMRALYCYEGKTVSIPAAVPTEEVEAAIWAELGLDGTKLRSLRDCLDRVDINAMAAQVAGAQDLRALREVFLTLLEILRDLLEQDRIRREPWLKETSWRAR